MHDVQFPPWLIQNLVTGLYNRNRNKSKCSTREHHHRTWGKACIRAINKLSHRYKIYIGNQAVGCEWQSLISYQVNKLSKRYDPIYLWGICEFKIMERWNSFDVGIEDFKSSLWQFKAVELVADLNKRIKSTRPKLKRSDNSIWTDLVGNASKRFSKSDNNGDLGKDWQLCYRYNADKLNKRNGYISWYSCISQNQKKIDRWSTSLLLPEANNSNLIEYKGDNDNGK